MKTKTFATLVGLASALCAAPLFAATFPLAVFVSAAVAMLWWLERR